MESDPGERMVVAGNVEERVASICHARRCSILPNSGGDVIANCCMQR
jgi:hypothetical protein